MASDVTLFWSEKAIRDLENILEYLKSEWTTKEVNQFRTSLKYRLNLIKNYPKLFSPSTAKPNLRRSVLSKQTSIYYHINSQDQRVTIVRLFDNQMDIGKL